MKKRKNEGKEHYVDIPQLGKEEWLNVLFFSTRQEAIDYAKETFGADDNGMVSLISPPVIVEASRFCPKCGQNFAVHNDDGSCVEDDDLPRKEVRSWQREVEKLRTEHQKLLDSNRELIGIVEDIYRSYMLENGRFTPNCDGDQLVIDLKEAIINAKSNIE